MRLATALHFRDNSASKTVLILILIILRQLIFFLCFLISCNLYCDDSGFKYLNNYSYKEYDHQPQNWGMVQTENGLIYVANNGGILEYDGFSWRVIGIPNYDIVRSIAIDKAGTIFIGGNNKFGYLTPDPTGYLRYESLVDHLKENEKNFSQVWSTHVTGNSVYFRASNFLFCWDYQKIKVWTTSTSYKKSFVYNEDLIVQHEKKGLVTLANNSLELLPGSEIFSEEKIWMMVPYDLEENSRTLLIGTRSKGFYLYDGKTFRPFPTEVEGYLERNKLYQGIRLSSGDFALATLQGGIVIMDPQGRNKCILNKSSGLQADRVHYIFEDAQGNLWLCLDYGISKIEYASPFFLYDNRCGLSVQALTVIRHKDDLYVGTINGLYCLESPSKFNLIQGINISCWHLISIRNSIFAATSDGVFQVQKNIKNHIINDPSYVLMQSRQYPNLIWCGTNKGIVILSSEENGEWREKHRFEDINQEIKFIVEDKKDHIWLVTLTGSVLRIDLPVDFSRPKITRHEATSGLPGGRVYATEIAGHVMFATESGIFRFAENSNTFIPDRTLGDELAGGSQSKSVFRIAQDSKKNIWVHSESRNYQFVPQANQSYTIYYKPFRRIPLIQVNDIYPDSNGNSIWFANADGLIRYDMTIKKNYRQQFRTLVRKVTLNENQKNERPFFGGCEDKITREGTSESPIIPYQDRNLHFEYAASFFEAEEETRYQVFLEGYDEGWSDWDSKNQRNYPNLSPGLYTFKVKAENIYEKSGDEAIFRFRISQPWFQTWWAYLLYVIVFFGMTYLIYKWRHSIRLQHEMQRLEIMVRERTKEIHEKNKQLKEQSDKLKEMDSIKSRFFANISHEFRTPLTLIMGPIEQMLSDSRDKIQKKKLTMMLRNSQRLLTLINQLLDLSRFDSGKVKLQASRQDIVPFLKGTLASFHLLALQNKLNLEFESGEDDVYLYFDAPKMEEVMYNLLINAFRFTSPGGKITVSVSMDEREQPNKQNHQEKKNVAPGFVNISVSDTGVGIPKEQLSHIFDRFYQTRGPKQEVLKGIGIGLALVKENVLLHHGRIDVHSQEGKGTEFVIRMPLGHEHLDPGEIVDYAEVSPQSYQAHQPQKNKEIETFHMTAEDETEAEEDREMGELKKRDPEKPMILVVEDHVDVREYIRGPLESLYTVVEAGDGREGIARAKEIIPDLIVSDIMMPEVDGYELCRELKRDIKTSHIPIVLLTAKASEESIVAGLETGVDDYITKPFNTRILMTRIKNLIELRQQLQQKIQKQMLLQPAEISVSSMDQKFIKELQEMIEKNLSDPQFHVEELCNKLYMNRVTLFRKIKALTGESPTEFIRSYRLKRAAQLLKANFGNVSAVALEVGFSNLGYFTRCFKDKFQQLPSSYQASESK